MRRGFVPLIWLAIVAVATLVAGNTLADSKNAPDSPLHGAQTFFENAKESVLSAIGQDASYKEQLKDKRAWEVKELKKEGKPEEARQLEAKEGLVSPNITAGPTPVSPEQRPIKGVSRTLCEIYRATAPSTGKDYTLTENQPVTLETGQKVTLVVAYRNIATNEPGAGIKVESDNSSMDGFLSAGQPVRVLGVMATLKDVPQFGTATISLRTSPPRTQPIVFGYLMRFGSSMGENELRDVADAFETAFENATQGRVHLCVTIGGSAPLPPEDATHRYSDARAMFPWLRDESLPRLWYGDKVLRLDSDIEAAASKLGFSEAYDVLIVLSEAAIMGEGLGGAKYESAGYNTGISRAEGERTAVRNIIAVNQPLERGYLSGAGYRTENQTLYRLSDAFVHEMGHHMGLQHSCKSADVMSDCVARPTASDAFYRVFSDCSLDWISKVYVPALLKYEAAPWQPTPCP